MEDTVALLPNCLSSKARYEKNANMMLGYHEYTLLSLQVILYLGKVAYMFHLQRLLCL